MGPIEIGDERGSRIGRNGRDRSRSWSEAESMQRECRSPGIERHDINSLEFEFSCELRPAPYPGREDATPLADCFLFYAGMGLRAMMVRPRGGPEDLVSGEIHRKVMAVTTPWA